MNFLSDFYHYGRVFYGYAGRWLFLLFVIIVFGGLAEALGVSLLLPILTVGTGEASGDPFSRAIASALDVIGLEPSLGILLVGIIIVFSAKAIIIFLQRYLSMWIYTRIRRDIQLSLARLFGSMTYASYTSSSSGDMNNLLVREVPRFLQGFLEFTRMPVSIVNIIAYGGLSAVLRPDLTIILGVSGIVAIIALRRVVSLTKTYSMEVTQTAGSLQSLLIEYIQNLIYLKATASLSRTRPPDDADCTIAFNFNVNAMEDNLIAMGCTDIFKQNI